MPIFNNNITRTGNIVIIREFWKEDCYEKRIDGSHSEKGRRIGAGQL